MRLTVIGCSGSFPGPDAAASCYLIEAPYGDGTFRLLLDLGSGALGPLQRHASLESIDAVVLSHLHADHCLDLCGFYVVRKYHPQGALPRLPVYGPAGAAARLARAYDLDDPDGMSHEFEFRDYPTAPFQVGPFTVSAVEVDHAVLAYALKVSDGDATIVYSGDTGPCSSFDKVSAGADLLLAEASFVGADNPPHLHLTGRDAALVAKRGAVGQLVLTHIPPWHSPDDVMKQARPHFDGKISLAVPGATYELASARDDSSARGL